MCSTDAPISLSDLATTPGGSWSGVGVIDGSFNPNTGVSSLVTYTIGTGTCARSEEHEITVHQTPNADAGPDIALCGFDVEVNALPTGSGTWTANGDVQITAAGSPSTMVSVSEPGSHPLTWTVIENGCSASDTVVITFHDPAIGLTVDAGPDQVLEAVTSTQVEAIVPEGVSVNWSVLTGTGSIAQAQAPGTLVEGLSTGLNRLLVQATLGECPAGNDTLLIEVKDFFIPAGFSPNADGVNDLFVITGMDNYPGSALHVFNRWGQEVYGHDSYDNSWDGTSRSGSSLPDDTYFYLLDLSETGSYNGYIVIKR